MNPSRANPMRRVIAPAITDIIPASATARPVSPAARGRTVTAMIPARAESGPRTMMRLGPRRA